MLLMLFAPPWSAVGAQSNTVEWAMSGGGPNSDIGFAIAMDPSGDAVLVGRMADVTALAGQTSTPLGDLDAAIAKFSADGKLKWLRRPGGTERDSAQSIAIDAKGNALVTGFFRGTGRFGDLESNSAGHRDVFIAKYDSAGTLLWVRRAGGSLIDEGRGISTDPDGNVLVTGGFEGQASFDKDTSVTALGDGDAFIAKYDPNGGLLWVRQAGGEEHTWGNAIATDSAGNVLVSGAFSNTAKFDGTTLTSSNDLGAFVAKYSPNGKLLWAKVGDGSGRDIAYAISVDAEDSVLIAGNFSRSIQFDGKRLESKGSRDAFIAKYQADGTLAWAEAIGGPDDDAVRAIASDGRGDILLTGSFQGELTIGEKVLTSTGDRDVFIAALGADGKPVWARSVGGIETDNGFGIATDGRGGVYVTGSFASTAAFNGMTLSSAGSDDLFILKLHYETQ
jgi:Beta-propeller repeat